MAYLSIIFSVCKINERKEWASETRFIPRLKPWVFSLTPFINGMKITPKLGALYALGGLTMGLGTRFANGCNVDALYTPIASFSAAGWVFLVVMVIGGILGNTFAKMLQIE